MRIDLQSKRKLPDPDAISRLAFNGQLAEALGHVISQARSVVQQNLNVYNRQFKKTSHAEDTKKLQSIFVVYMVHLALRILTLSVVLAEVLPVSDSAAQSRQENQALCDSKNPELSIHGCSALIQSGQGTPENLAVFFNTRALAYRAKGETDRAIQDYDTAIRLKPDYAPAFNYRGNAYVARGDNDRGIKDYDEAIRLKPDYDVAFNNRGFTYLKLQNYAAAIADYDVALRIDSQRANSLYGRALAYRALGDTAKADADMAAAKQIKDDIEHVFAGYGISGN